MNNSRRVIVCHLTQETPVRRGSQTSLKTWQKLLGQALRWRRRCSPSGGAKRSTASLNPSECPYMYGVASAGTAVPASTAP